MFYSRGVPVTIAYGFPDAVRKHDTIELKTDKKTFKTKKIVEFRRATFLSCSTSNNVNRRRNIAAGQITLTVRRYASIVDGIKRASTSTVLIYRREIKILKM